MSRLFVCVVVAAVLGAGPAWGQSHRATAPPVADTSIVDRVLGGNWLVLPFASYAPNTGVAGGLLAGYYQTEQPGRPASSVQSTATVTQKRQLIVQVAPEWYLEEGRWRVLGDGQAAHFPNTFYGIGGETPESAAEDYTARYVLFDLTVQRRLRPNLRVGPRVFVRAGTVTEPERGGTIAREGVPGADGGLTAGIGSALQWDARDRRYYPTTGTYATVDALLHSAAWGSDYTFGRGRTDLRAYRPLGIGVLAGQVYAEAVTGTAPFQLLPLLGGPDRLRGYQEGRFRDNVYWTAQAEYRFPLFWRFKATTFAALGEAGPRVGVPLVQDVEVAVGIGGRLQLNEDGVHGRVDVAYGREGLEFYLSLGEAF
ncbi:MAG: hypothetical protein BRD55_01640 [Bacteroidetes bacterium SW_9_63_38]|nr:MAG: hypothetical protein BRD55_01640 [Bacteroidetes bacterium SW_9_63_38]